MADDCVIAVLLPSRGRPATLARSIGTLLVRADYPGRVAVIVGADNDDPATVRVTGDCDVSCLVMPRQGYPQLHAYYQALAATPDACAASWLLVWNDDATMLTTGWDSVLDGLPASVMVADLKSRHSPTCCFPAVRNEAVGIIGRFCSGNPHVDSFWQEVGRMSGTIATVPIEVCHDQRPHAHSGNEHGFHDPQHRAELAECARLLRAGAEGL